MQSHHAHHAWPQFYCHTPTTPMGEWVWVWAWVCGCVWVCGGVWVCRRGRGGACYVTSCLGYKQGGARENVRIRYGVHEMRVCVCSVCAWPWSYDHRPSHPYYAGTEHGGFSPTRKTLLAPSPKRREVFG